MRRLHEILFTRSVRAEQMRRGSREHYERDLSPNVTLGIREEEFVHARDGFYLSTVNEDGWPYVQFRGGPRGFLRHTGGNVLRFPDFRGNYQFISVGNAAVDDRCCMFLMDYSTRRRLKILGHLSFEDAPRTPEARAELGVADYVAVVERVARVRVAAFEWNCSQHIPRRLTAEEATSTNGVPT